MQDYAGKIAALLAKAERTDNPHEAEAFTAKATELMIRWGVDQAAVDAAALGKTKTEEIIQDSVEFTGTYHAGTSRIASQVGLGLGLRVIQIKLRTKTGIAIRYIGFESDVQRALMLSASLQLQGATAQRVWWKDFEDKAWMTAMEKFKARRHFLISFGNTVGQRIHATRNQVVEEAGTGTELVLADRKSQVDAWVDEQYGKLDKVKSRLSGSHAGAAAGAAAGNRADIGQTAVGGQSRGIEA